MSRKAITMKRLFDAGKISIDGLRRAVNDGVITVAEFKEISGEDFE